MVETEDDESQDMQERWNEMEEEWGGLEEWIEEEEGRW